MSITLSKNRLATMEQRGIKVGRPTKYTKHIAKILPYMFINGESVAEVCVQLGICKDTFYNWRKEHKEFSDSYKRGLTYSEAWWTVLGRLGAAGKEDINAATWIFNMKNRFNWLDKVESKIEVSQLPEIQVIMPVGFVPETEEEYQEKKTDIDE